MRRYGGIGRHAGFRFQFERVQVRVLLAALVLRRILWQENYLHISVKETVIRVIKHITIAKVVIGRVIEIRQRVS